MWLVGKGAEILRYIAENEPCTQYDLRQRKEWSSRTVWKQVHRLERYKLIQRKKEGYEVTDLGFLLLFVALQAVPVKILEKAVRKYPGGDVDTVLGGILKGRRAPPIEETVAEFLKKPDSFILCRTDTEGKLVRTRRFWPAIDPKTGKCNLRLLQKVDEKWWKIDLK